MATFMIILAVIGLIAPLALIFVADISTQNDNGKLLFALAVVVLVGMLAWMASL